MSDSVTIEDSKGETFAEVIDVVGVSEVKKAFQQSVKEGSLHKWFKGSKSKDGKPGWVNVVTGGTCASDKPGEGTPKCVSSSKRASMTKAERLSAARRKKKADPNQQAKSGAAKPTYVSTDKPKKKMKEELEQVNEVMGVVKKAVKLPGKITKLPGQMAASVLPEPLKTGVKLPGKIASLPTDTVANLIPGGKKKMKEEVKRDEYGDPIGGPKISKKQMKKNLTSNTPDEQHTTTTSEGYIDLPLHVEIPKSDGDFRLGLMFRESLDIDKGMLFIFEEVGQHSFHMKNTRIPLDIAFVKEDGTIESIKQLKPYSSLPVYSDGKVLFAIEANRGWFTENNVEVGDEIVLSEVKDKKGKGSGTKDACYHKVKSRYSVWPSAYASGALVKCRKVGAANWGNKSESVEMKNYLDKKAKKLEKQRSSQPDRYKNNPAFDSTSPNSKDPAVARSRAEEYIPEEGYDIARDRGMVRPSKDKKDATSYPPSEEMKKLQKVNKGPSALDRVKKKYKGQIMDVKKEEVELDEKCWKGYEKKGMKTMFGKRYPNCVKKEGYSDWRDELELSEKVGGAGTLVRQGVKVGGKKGGRAVQKGQDMAVKAGQGAKETAKAGNKSKMVGSGKFEKAGALAGGVAGGLAGGVVDGPLPIGDIVGGIAGAKVGGKLGRQIDKIGAKKPMKEENIDELKVFGKPIVGKKGEAWIYNDPKGRREVLQQTGKDPGVLNKPMVKKELIDPISRTAVKAGVIGATALTGAALAKRLMKKSDKKESFSNWREEVGYEGKDDSKKIEEGKSPAWQRKEGKSESGGLNKKGVASYRAANPGSKLKTAVTTKPSKLKKGSKAANRRKSFCKRMTGMKKKLTSAKTARDPDSRINKALRKWNC